MPYLFATHAAATHTSASILLETALHSCMNNQLPAPCWFLQCIRLFLSRYIFGGHNRNLLATSGHQCRGLGFCPLLLVCHRALVRCPAYAKLTSSKPIVARLGGKIAMSPRPLCHRYVAKRFNHLAPSEGPDDFSRVDGNTLVTPEPASSTLFLEFLRESRKDLENTLLMILFRTA